MRESLPERILKGLQEKGLQAERDPASGAVVMTDPRGLRTAVDFAANGQPGGVVLPSGARIGLEIGQDNQLTKISYPGGESLNLGYDARGNLEVIDVLGGPRHRLIHDDSDRLTRVEFPDESATEFHYGAQGLERFVDRTGAITTYKSDEARGVATIVDPLGRTTTLLSDGKGELQRIVLPDGTEQRLTLDEDQSLLVGRRDGSVVRYQHRAEDASVVIAWSEEEQTKFSRGEQRNSYRLQNAASDTELILDDKNQPIGERASSGAVDYAYDADGRLSELKTSHGSTAAYAYDEDGRLASIIWGESVCRFEHAPIGAVTAVHYGSAFVERRELGPRGFVVRSTFTDTNGDILSEQRYSYDVCDRLVEVADIWGPGDDESEHRRFATDAEGRLLAEIDPASERVVREYDYDRKGNLVYDDGERVSFGVMDQPLIYKGRDLAYDANGNVLSFPARDGGDLSCTWGSDGTLRQITKDDIKIHFTYDGMGRRITKSGPRLTWRYGWAAGLLLWEESTDQVNGEIVRRDYLYKPDGTPLAFREQDKTYWLQTDPRGAVVRAFDDTGTVVWRARYESFGLAHVEVGLVRQPLRLAGQYEDEETGLHYNLARYYCPWIKIYLSLDPSWSSFGATNYSYAKNDPWNYVDPSGGVAFAAVLVVAGPLAIGALVGGLIGGVIALLCHEPFWPAFVGGAISGFCTVAGGLIGGPPGLIIGGAIGTFLGTLVEGRMSGQGWCWKCAAINAAVSVVLDLLFLGLGRIPGVQKVLQRAVKGMDGLLKKIPWPKWWPKSKFRYNAKTLPRNPDELVTKGRWKEVTDPRMTANSGRREFVDPETGQKVAFDKGKPGATGFEGKDHYHVYNPNSTGKGDYYLDIDGNPVPKNSKDSHVLPPAP